MQTAKTLLLPYFWRMSSQARLPREDFSAYAVLLNSLVVEVSVVWTRGPSFVFRGRIPTKSNTAPTEKRTRETDGRIELRINPGVANANPRTKTHDCKEGLVHVGISSTTALVCRHLSQTTHVAPPNKYPDRRRVPSPIHSSDWENGICTENACGSSRELARIRTGLLAGGIQCA